MKNFGYNTQLCDAWVNAFNDKYPGSAISHNYDSDIDTHIIVIDAKNWKSRKRQKLFSSVCKEAGLKYQMNMQFIPKGSKPNYVEGVRKLNKKNVANERLRRIKQDV